MEAVEKLEASKNKCSLSVNYFYVIKILLTLLSQYYDLACNHSFVVQLIRILTSLGLNDWKIFLGYSSGIQYFGIFEELSVSKII